MIKFIMNDNDKMIRCVICFALCLEQFQFIEIAIYFLTMNITCFIYVHAHIIINDYGNISINNKL